MLIVMLRVLFIYVHFPPHALIVAVSLSAAHLREATPDTPDR